MKQKFFLSLLAIALTVLSASAKNSEGMTITAGNVEHLNIENDMDVVLMQAPAGDNSVIVDQQASEKLNLRLSNKELVITAKKSYSKNKRLTVYLYVNNLKTITVAGNSQVQTIGTLNTPKLDVFVDGIAQVHLKTNGLVMAHSLNDSNIEVKYLTEPNLVKRGY